MQSMAAFAADAADDAPRASMISAPRLPTRGMYSFSYQSMSTWSTARSPLTFALKRSGNIVGEWLPQDGQVPTVPDAGPPLPRERSHRAVLVEPRHRGEALVRDVRGVAHGD